MENVVYCKNMDDCLLKSLNIIIDKQSCIEDGVEISSNVCITNSVIGKDCKIFSYSVIENSVIGPQTTIKSSYIKDSVVKHGCNIGPFAHIRMKTELGSLCRVGNFVEIKNSQIGSGCKMAHLTYIGDAQLGDNCNIGCGVVFCNYNGKIKQNCVLGNNVFVGSNVNLIAPISIGDSAFIAAGSTINRDIQQNEFAIARAKQENKQKK